MLKVLRGPILLIQGRQTKRTALRLPEAEGQRHDSVSLEGSDETLKLLFVGDLTMAGVGSNQSGSGNRVTNSRAVSNLLSRPVRCIAAVSGRANL
jgi:hypothetical protein